MEITTRLEFKGEFEGFITGANASAKTAFEIINRYNQTRYIENGYVHNLDGKIWLKAFDGSFALTICDHKLLYELYFKLFDQPMTATHATPNDASRFVVTENTDSLERRVSYMRTKFIVAAKFSSLNDVVQNLHDIRFVRYIRDESTMVLENTARDVEVICRLDIDPNKLDMREVWREHLTAYFEDLSNELENIPMDI